MIDYIHFRKCSVAQERMWRGVDQHQDLPWYV